MKLKDIGEFGIIDYLRRKEKGRNKDIICGIGDDCAVIDWKKDYYLLATTDTITEGVHFDLKSATPFQIGYKALAVNISDISAMGGIPLYALFSLGMNKFFPFKSVQEIYSGFRSLAKKYKVSLIGGDLTSSKNLTLTITLLGKVEKKFLTLRSGAKCGDSIFITGAIGGSICGKHLTFIPRIKEARYLVKELRPTSMIDISDGLFGDLQRIIEASKAGALIYKEKVPLTKEIISLAKEKGKDPFFEAGKGGEDFELLFTLSPDSLKRIKKGRIKITEIGKITEEKGIWISEEGNKKPLKVGGFNHFKR